jgi:hypothetical protein
MRGVFLAPKDENNATEFTEVTERRFSSQTQHTQGFPSVPSCSLWLKTEFTEVTERRFSSQTQHRRRFPSILSVLSVLSVAQISIPLVSNATQGRIQSSRSQKTTLAGDCFSRCALSQ